MKNLKPRTLSIVQIVLGLILILLNVPHHGHSLAGSIFGLFFGVYSCWLGLAQFSEPANQALAKVHNNRWFLRILIWSMAIYSTVYGAYLFVERNHVTMGGGTPDYSAPAVNTFWGPVLFTGGMCLLYILIRKRDIIK